MIDEKKFFPQHWPNVLKYLTKFALIKWLGDFFSKIDSENWMKTWGLYIKTYLYIYI